MACDCDKLYLTVVDRFYHDHLERNMRTVNLYVLTRNMDETIWGLFEKELSMRSSQLKLRVSEIEQLKVLVNCFILYKAPMHIMCDWIYSFKIPQISKEFDLIKFEDQGVAVNIELKSQEVSKEKIEKQLLQNRYYLSHVCRDVFSFTFVLKSDGTSVLYKQDDKLKQIPFEELIKCIMKVKKPVTNCVENYFKPKRYLVSPINTPDLFIRKEYFLNDQQETIKNKICKNVISGEHKIWGITGSAGTGKTLLLYDIARECGKSCKVCLIHSGILSEGHKTLNSICEEFDIIPAKNISNETLSGYDVVFIDEAQRLFDCDLKIIQTLYEKLIILSAVFAYDYRQCLSRAELSRAIPQKLADCDTFSELKLKSSIRINEEIIDFVERMLRTKKERSIDHEYANIDVIYANDIYEADRITNIYLENGYIFLTFTPSRYKDNSIDHYAQYMNSHNVIGQEFDKVMIVMDDNFRYDENGDLTAKVHPNPDYLFAKMFYQNVTRAREKLCILVVGNAILFEKLLEVKS